jgi:hypothetical protein
MFGFGRQHFESMSQYTTIESEGLQTMIDHNAPEALYQNTTPTYTDQPRFDGETQKDDNANSYTYVPKTKAAATEPSRTILGMRKTTFILLLLFIAASVAAILVGAVLGSRKTSR